MTRRTDLIGSSTMKDGDDPTHPEPRLAPVPDLLYGCGWLPGFRQLARASGPSPGPGGRGRRRPWQGYEPSRATTETGRGSPAPCGRDLGDPIQRRFRQSIERGAIRSDDFTDEDGQNALDAVDHRVSPHRDGDSPAVLPSRHRSREYPSFHRSREAGGSPRSGAGPPAEPEARPADRRFPWPYSRTSAPRPDSSSGSPHRSKPRR